MNYESLMVSNIKRLIDQSGYKKRFVAEQIGLKDYELSAILSNRKRLSVESVPKIANVLGVTPNDLFALPESGQH